MWLLTGKEMYEKHLWVDNLEVVIGSDLENF